MTHDDAAAYGARSLDLARGHGERGNEAWALRLLGEVTSRQGAGERDRSLAHYASALTLATELGMAPLVAHCHLGVGRLHGQAGRREAAEEHRATASAMYGEMGMGFWLECARPGAG